MKRIGAHEQVAQLGHGAFGPIGFFAEQQEAEGRAEERIPDEFKALVVRQNAAGGMSKSLFQQGGVSKPIAQATFQVGTAAHSSPRVPPGIWRLRASRFMAARNRMFAPNWAREMPFWRAFARSGGISE